MGECREKARGQMIEVCVLYPLKWVQGSQNHRKWFSRLGNRLRFRIDRGTGSTLKLMIATAGPFRATSTSSIPIPKGGCKSLAMEFRRWQFASMALGIPQYALTNGKPGIQYCGREGKLSQDNARRPCAGSTSTCQQISYF